MQIHEFQFTLVTKVHLKEKKNVLLLFWLESKKRYVVDFMKKRVNSVFPLSITVFSLLHASCLQSLQCWDSVQRIFLFDYTVTAKKRRVLIFIYWLILKTCARDRRNVPNKVKTIKNCIRFTITKKKNDYFLRAGAEFK